MYINTMVCYASNTTILTCQHPVQLHEYTMQPPKCAKYTPLCTRAWHRCSSHARCQNPGGGQVEHIIQQGACAGNQVLIHGARPSEVVTCSCSCSGSRMSSGHQLACLNCTCLHCHCTPGTYRCMQPNSPCIRQMAQLQENKAWSRW